MTCRVDSMIGRNNDVEHGDSFRKCGSSFEDEKINTAVGDSMMAVDLNENNVARFGMSRYTGVNDETVNAFTASDATLEHAYSRQRTTLAKTASPTNRK